MNPELKQIMENNQEEGRRWKLKLRVKIMIALAMLSAVLAAGTYGAYKANQFFEYNRLVFRGPVQSPIVVVKRQAAEEANKPVRPKDLTEKDLVLSKNNGEILWRIYGLESQWGKLDNCRKSGLFNGFGYRQHSQDWQCYKSFEEVVNLADQWFTDRGEMSLPESICLYNTGHQIRNCQYYQSYLKLNAD